MRRQSTFLIRRGAGLTERELRRYNGAFNVSLIKAARIVRRITRNAHNN